jgi:hypothetical protein
LFRDEKSHQVIVPKLCCDVIKIKLAGFVLTQALENRRVIIATLRVKDAPDPILFLKTENIRPSVTNRKIIRTTTLLE